MSQLAQPFGFASQPLAGRGGPVARRGAKNAILAVATSMLTAAYYVLRDGTEYADLGCDTTALEVHAA